MKMWGPLSKYYLECHDANREHQTSYRALLGPGS